MIGLDTNVLLRLFLLDDAVQAGAARALFEGLSPEEPGFISIITLVELNWTLRRLLRLSRQQINDIIAGLLESSDLVLEDEGAVEEALELMAGDDTIDLADILISLRNGNAGCKRTVTFDRTAAAKIPGMELLT